MTSSNFHSTAILGFFAAGVLGFAAHGKAAEKYEVDPSHSTLIFSVKHLNTSYFYGRFNSIEGSLVVDATNPKHSSIEIKIQAGSIDTNDEKRDKHLKGPDFFNAKQFPTITFKSTKVQNAKKEGNLRITGDFTLHGVTRSIKATAAFVGAGKDPWGNFRRGYDVRFKIKRSDFGMNYMPDLLGDEIEIFLGIEAVKK